MRYCHYYDLHDPNFFSQWRKRVSIRNTSHVKEKTGEKNVDSMDGLAARMRKHWIYSLGTGDTGLQLSESL